MLLELFNKDQRENEAEVATRNYASRGAFCLVKTGIPFLRPGWTVTEFRLRLGCESDGGRTPSFWQALKWAC
jgi:hypothetical protein